MVGAVGIENNDDWNFKDLQEMLESAKVLKRTTEMRENSYWPLKAPDDLPWSDTSSTASRAPRAGNNHERQ